MSIRGVITVECDTKDCHAEDVLDADSADFTEGMKSGVQIELYAAGWRMDDDGLFHCPQCCEDGREKGADDGHEYSDPRDARTERL
jgi:hypothetical protein